jgi:hypothetical protein
MIIENKIYHGLLNPLDDYEDFIKSSYPEKEVILTILSLSELAKVPQGWNTVLYREFISEIKRSAGPYMFNENNAKWSFFLQDFLLNIEELIGDITVDKEMMDFVQKNYKRILDLMEVKDNYITILKKSFATIIHENSKDPVTEKIHNWSKNRVAIRFFCPNVWNEQTNLVLVINPSGDFKIYYYVYGIEKSNQEMENHKLLLKEYQHWKENYETILCYKSSKSYNLSDAKKEFELVVKHLNEYFSSQSLLMKL